MITSENAVDVALGLVGVIILILLVPVIFFWPSKPRERPGKNNL